MFNLSEPEQPINPPELTKRELSDLEDALKWKEERIQAEVERRAVDPEYIIDSLIVLLTDNPHTRNLIVNIIRGKEYRDFHITGVKLDILDWLKYKVTKEMENGRQ